jgi:hypothetical protein
MFRRAARAALTALPALGCLLLLGCGGEKTYRVSGNVTFKGQPLPVGKIYFIPDGSKGNTGPSGYADIKDGKYDTDATGGRGCAGGPMIIAIEGTDPNAPPAKAKKGEESAEATVKLLFPRYEVKEDLPKSDVSKNYEVPAEAEKGPTQKKTGEIIP